MKLVYQLKDEHERYPERVKRTQALTLDESRPCMGLSQRLGLFGSPAWWENLQNGAIKHDMVSGEITGLYPPDRDEPEMISFAMVTRYEEVDHAFVELLNSADAGLFRVGCRVDIFFCYDELKHQPANDGGIAYAKRVVEMAVSLDPVQREERNVGFQTNPPLLNVLAASSSESAATFLCLDDELPMKRVFRLSEHHRRHPHELRRKQELTLDQSKPKDGLCGDRGVYGSNEWWHYLQRKKIHRQLIQGVITRVYVGLVEGETSPVQLIDVETSRETLVGLKAQVNDDADLALFRERCRVDLMYVRLKRKEQWASGDDRNYALEVLEMAVSLEPMPQV